MASPKSQNRPLWIPQHPESTPISKYRKHVNDKFKQSLQNSQQLHKWSIKHCHDFWIDLWDYVGVTPALPKDIKFAYDPSKTIRDVPIFFDGMHINYAENVLSNRDPDAVALIGLREGQSLDGEKWNWADLAENVRKVRSSLIRTGIRRGDRVGALMSNSNWTIAIFLATASMGAIFSSVSSEMGTEGCISRFKQISPSVLFTDSHQTYKGKRRSMEEKIIQTVEALERTPAVFVIPLTNQGTFGLPSLKDFLSVSRKNDKLEYLRLPFSEPMVILYSSGTSGPPKCMVHQHGIILQLKKIALLHNSLTSNDVVFQYSSTSWVLWNIMNGHLSTGSTLICYDGSPLYPDASTKLRICEHHKVTYFGTSPRYLLELEMSDIQPSKFDLSSLRMVTTTGATLTTDQFHWFYRAFPSTVHLSSVAGGTEICTSWVTSDTAGPVYAGEMQMPALGQDVDVVHPETGESIKHTGEAGELICRTPFPSMPIYFWNDAGNVKYNEAYFERFTKISVWAQHDWIQFNPATGGCQIHGRSDGTLNPSGIRFGSAEIYSIIESPDFIDQVADSLCVGRKRITDRDETVFLFVKMRDGQHFSTHLRDRIVKEIRVRLSPRHVPRFILPIENIPVTINGKKVELAVKKIISGQEVQVSATVANPECLQAYHQYKAYEQKKHAKL